MMTENARPLLTEEARQILERHLAVGQKKPVSYLPIKTIGDMIGITIQEYVSLIEKSGNKVAIFGAEDCCMNSGAVYAYSCTDLAKILQDNRAVLADNGWPTAPASFVERMAAEWLNEENPVMPVIRKAFGDE